MRLLLLMIPVLFSLSCADKKSSVVYLEERSATGLKKIKEVCETDVDEEVCREIYIKPVPVKTESLYEKEKKKVLLKMLRNLPSPVRTPDEVLKVYILPYTDSRGNFHSGEYVFIVVEDGRWLMGKQVEEKKERKLLIPLKEKKDEGR